MVRSPKVLKGSKDTYNLYYTGQRQNAREEHRGRKSHLVVSLLNRSAYSQRFDGAPIVLKGNKLWIDTTGASRSMQLHPCTLMFLTSSWRRD